MNAFTVCGVCLFPAAAMAGATVDLDVSSLPSTQAGWLWVAVGNHGALAEADYFSTDGSVLTADSIGQAVGFAPGSAYASYDVSSLDMSGGVFRMDLSARVLNAEVVQFNYGFHIGMYGGGRGMSLGFGPGMLTSASLTGYAFDATGWHDYTMIGDWDAGTYTVFVDGQLLFTESLISTSAVDVRIGDGTGTGNAAAEIASFSFSIPAPAAGGLLAGFGLANSRCRRA